MLSYTGWAKIVAIDALSISSKQTVLNFITAFIPATLTMRQSNDELQVVPVATYKMYDYAKCIRYIASCGKL